MFGSSMFGRKRSHVVPGLNTTSTADISFMLLIFFLVTTSMDADKGITRELPPIDKKEATAPTNVSKDKTLRLHIDSNGKLFCNDRPMRLDEVKDSVEAVAERGGKDHVIQLKTERDASYDAYFQVQNRIIAAYNDLRNKKSEEAYGESFEELNEEQKASVVKAVPQRISETYVQEGGKQ